MSDAPEHLAVKRNKVIPITKKMDDVFKRPVYKVGDGDYKYPQRPGSDAAFKLPSRGLI